MDQPLVPQMDGIGAAIKRKRTQTSRRPRPEAQPLPDRSSTPVSDDMSKVSSDENNGDGNSGGKMFNLNQCVSRSLPVSGLDSGSNPILSNDVCDGTGSESRLKKVKLKVGGVTRTIQTKIGSNGASGSVSSVKANQSTDNARPRQRPIPEISVFYLLTKLNVRDFEEIAKALKLAFQHLANEFTENPDEYNSPSLGKKRGLQGIPWKDFSKGNFSIGKDGTGRTTSGKNNAFEKQGDINNNKSDSVRKSKRAPKRRVLDADFDDDDEDDEIRYLEKLKSSKITGYRDLETQSTRKLQKGGKLDNLEDVGRVGSKSRPGDMDYEEDEDPSSDGDPEGKRKKKLKKDLSELVSDNKREMALTTRQRALLSKDASASGASQIEFPNGLPPAPPRKQKEKLTEVEQQLKKAEAAQRRRMQNEKAARESEAEAIRKILGQDSSRKKREEKIKKRQEEMAQGKATNAHMLSSNTIRIVMGPTGTTVTFPQELGLPKIFDSKPCSYPPPREKCAGPFCTNDYKYRDSKLMLPLCSLQCYKAINEKLQAGKVC
ncbi:hypothetical protein PHJA_002299500 [Phtheirospermum japonicum]|uniref:INO80 complex subunit B-like conserved region domain-containing protein n=1 Tax=Phtheirospermum japonicum TaxID=374723 RepID=A0A830D2V8_9LAMI|nr:hypothetical protein PHJA_002299500 [Phtheirospermum japonicum]